MNAYNLLNLHVNEARFSRSSYFVQASDVKFFLNSTYCWGDAYCVLDGIGNLMHFRQRSAVSMLAFLAGADGIVSEGDALA